MTGSGLHVGRLRAGYPPVAVLQGVDITVPPGAVTAILGPNGAGKTTLLRAIFGLAHVFSGHVHFNDVDLRKTRRHELAGLGLCYVTEGRAIYRSLSVSENLDMFAAGRASTEGLDRVFEVLPKLAERRHQVAGTMSGGEQQMLAMARTLMEPWGLLLIDEVSMGLAPVVIDEIFEVLDFLRGEGTAILLVEQYAERALAVAEIVYVLAGGTVRFAGEANELTGAGGQDILELYLGEGGHDDESPPRSTRHAEVVGSNGTGRRSRRTTPLRAR